MIREKISDRLTAAAVCAAALLLVWAGREASQGAAAAVQLCLTVMIPSLFAFTVISKLLVDTEIYRQIGRPFGALSRYIFRIPEELFPLFLISQAAGYPIGAALIGEMHRQGKISRREGEMLLCCCIAPGPAYIMAVSAAAAPGCPGMSGVMFVSLFGANLLLALASALFRKIPPKKTDTYPVKSLSAEEFTGAVRSGAESMLMICAMIVFMSAMLGIAEKAGILAWTARIFGRLTNISPSEIFPFVRSFFEISNITSAFGDPAAVIPAAAAFLSFGGLCVHMQISAVCGDISPLPALLARIPASAAAFLICRSLMPEFYTVSVVAANAELNNASPQIISENPPILSVFLLIMTILIISQKSIVKNEKI